MNNFEEINDFVFTNGIESHFSEDNLIDFFFRNKFISTIFPVILISLCSIIVTGYNFVNVCPY